MRTLLLLSSAILLSACGGSSSGTPTGQQAQAVPASTNRVQPIDSIPPINAQQAPINSQPPPINAQQAPNNSQPPPNAGTLTPDVTTICNTVIAQLRGAGCDVNDTAEANCIAVATPGAKCSTEVLALLQCLQGGFTCDQAGDIVNVSQACFATALQLNTCMGGTNPTVPVACTAPNCDGCPDDCSTCTCRALTDQNRDCSRQCQMTTN